MISLDYLVQVELLEAAADLNVFRDWKEIGAQIKGVTEIQRILSGYSMPIMLTRKLFS